MNIYLLTQSDHNGWDTYDSCVVVAESTSEAQKISPWDGRFSDSEYAAWASRPENVSVELLGTADSSYTEPHVILASYNAG